MLIVGHYVFPLQIEKGVIDLLAINSEHLNQSIDIDKFCTDLAFQMYNVRFTPSHGSQPSEISCIWSLSENITIIITRTIIHSSSPYSFSSEPSLESTD